MTTTTPAPVVLAADGTPSSEGALRYAVQEAVTRQTCLSIIHVNPMATPTGPIRPVPGFAPVIPHELDMHARKVLEHVRREALTLAPELDVSATLAHGGRVAAITDSASDAQLVVVGRETRHGMERVLTGATTAGVASRAKCPVVVVPGNWQPQDQADSPGTLLVAIRRSADADLMASAHAWASQRGLAITVLHAWELPDSTIDRIEARAHAAEWQSRGEQLLEEALTDWRQKHPEVHLETHVVHGHPASVLAAAAQGADVLMVRRAHESRPFDHLGATVRALLLACPTPVVVVPTHHAQEPEGDLVLEESGYLAK